MLVAVLLGTAACSVYDGSLAGGDIPDGGAGGSRGGSSTIVGTSGTAGSVADGGAAVGGSTATAGAAGNNLEGGAGTSGVGGSAGSSGATGTSGGSSGSGGGTVDAGFAAAPTGICSYSNPITLLYTHWPTATTLIDFSFKLVNGSTQSISLNSVTVRYYLSNEIASPTATVTYGDICCPDKDVTTHVKAAVQPLSPTAPGADTYVEIGFDSTSGFLDPADVIEVEVDYMNAIGSTLNATNDYSYVATATGAQSQWDNCPAMGNCTAFHSCVMTVYQSGALIWGNPPR